MKTITVNGRNIGITNPDKVIFPSCGLTKAGVLGYYGRIAPFILPHLDGRALTLIRYPHGVDGEYFYEKRCPARRPEWLETAEIPYGSKPDGRGRKINYCMANNLETLVWLENLASIELHVPLAKAAAFETPDSVVFDLDPGDGAGIAECVKTALIIRDLLAAQKLSCWVKTSGKKGLHLFVPLNTGNVKFDETKIFSAAVARIMQNNYPDLVTARMDKKFRKGRVFINWSQNDASKTMACVYSMRAGESPTVSCPMEWKELESLSVSTKAGKFRVLYSEAVERVGKFGDLFGEVLVKRQRLPEI